MKWVSLSLAATGLFFAALPATSTYKLNSYGFGSGGIVNSQTATYSLEGMTGELDGQAMSTATQTLHPGYVVDQQANVPKLLSSDNGSGQYYNKIHFVIDTQGNPSDAKYLVTVSTSATIDATTHEFTTSPRYLQTDGTLSAGLTASDYQTYAGLGGSTGSFIIGLDQNTHYYIHLKATQGAKTESAYGPVTDQPTAAESLSFSLVTSAQSTPPFTVGLGTLNVGTVTTSPATINTTLSTNGASGGDVYIKGQNGGLLSSSTGNKIAAASTDLGSAAEGFGAQNSSISQTSGSTYSVVAPYNSTGSSVGIVDATNRSLYTTSGPVTNGAGVLALLAKASSADKVASDYQEVLTFISAANF